MAGVTGLTLIDGRPLEPVIEEAVERLRGVAYSMGSDPSRYQFLSAAKKAEKLLDAMRSLPRA